MEGIDQVAIIVFDGVGSGRAHDTTPEENGVNSLVNAARVHRINAPGLQSMGLEHISGLAGLHVAREHARERIRGAFGSLEPTFSGNGSPEGHQALMGHIVKNPYQVFNVERIPLNIEQIVQEAVTRVTGRTAVILRYPDTDDVSGTVFIDHPNIGAKHFRSKNPAEPLYVPIYASSDSLIQIALHQDVVPQEQIETIGKAVRKLLTDRGFRVARVIMRPFRGEPGKFKRVAEDRQDYGVNPDDSTLIDHLAAEGVERYSVGKAGSMVNYRGFDEKNCKKLKTDIERIMEIREWVKSGKRGLMFGNLVQTDEDFGHRRNPQGYIDHIAAMDEVIAAIIEEMGENVLLMVTSDHGNDPTYEKHTNHTREQTPLLVASKRIITPIDLGVRETFADVAATIAEVFKLRKRPKVGKSFLPQIAA